MHMNQTHCVQMDAMRLDYFHIVFLCSRLSCTTAFQVGHEQVQWIETMYPQHIPHFVKWDNSKTMSSQTCMAIHRNRLETFAILVQFQSSTTCLFYRFFYHNFPFDY